MRVSKGLTVTEYLGSFGKLETNSFGLSHIDADKVITCSIRNDSKLEPGA